MEPFEDDSLVTALESLRPAPRPAFAAELDQRAAAGFPLRPRSAGTPLARLGERVRAFEPRRALIPAGATALAAVAAVTVVAAIGENGDGLSPTHPNSSIESAVPNVSEQPRRVERSATDSASSAAQIEPLSEEGAAKAAPPPNAGPYASQAPRREIERSAQMVLATDPIDVRKAASEVFETVHAYRGIVLSSSIRDGAEGEAGARFELLIPSAKLGDALAAFSDIAEVRSRHEATADITAPTVRTGEQLRDSRARIECLLAELARADTGAERVAAETQLRAERRHDAYLRSQLSSLQRRANLSHVSLRIETGAAASSPDATGGWGVGDALDDAGHILGDRRRRHHRRPRNPRPDRPRRPARLARQPRPHPPRPCARPRLIG